MQYHLPRSAVTSSLAAILLSACSFSAERADEKQEIACKPSAAERPSESAPPRDRIKQFDFVFVDERNVLDRAVFEGNTMIAHAIAAP